MNPFFFSGAANMLLNQQHSAEQSATGHQSRISSSNHTTSEASSRNGPSSRPYRLSIRASSRNSVSAFLEEDQQNSERLRILQQALMNHLHQSSRTNLLAMHDGNDAQPDTESLQSANNIDAETLAIQQNELYLSSFKKTRGLIRSFSLIHLAPQLIILSLILVGLGFCIHFYLNSLYADFFVQYLICTVVGVFFIVTETIFAVLYFKASRRCSETLSTSIIVYLSLYLSLLLCGNLLSVGFVVYSPLTALPMGFSILKFCYGWIPAYLYAKAVYRTRNRVLKRRFRQNLRNLAQHHGLDEQTARLVMTASGQYVLLVRPSELNTPNPDAVQPAQTDLPPVDVDKFPTIIFSKSAVSEVTPSADGQLEVRYDSCSVCLEEFEESCKVTELPCSHWFHYECMSRWLESGKYSSCPLCRLDLRTVKGKESENGGSPRPDVRNGTATPRSNSDDAVEVTVSPVPSARRLSNHSIANNVPTSPSTASTTSTLTQHAWMNPVTEAVDDEEELSVPMNPDADDHAAPENESSRVTPVRISSKGSEPKKSNHSLSNQVTAHHRSSHRSSIVARDSSPLVEQTFPIQADASSTIQLPSNQEKEAPHPNCVESEHTQVTQQNSKNGTVSDSELVCRNQSDVTEGDYEAHLKIIYSGSEGSLDSLV